MFDSDKLYDDFKTLLDSFTKEDLEEWLEFDKKRLEDSKNKCQDG